jgi:F-box and WD-40 domain protein 1/11
MNIINTLPTAVVVGIVDSVRPRLFINFLNRLPQEICLKVLGFLDPLSLINTARASRDWMSLSMDSSLWQRLYYLEGWKTVTSEVKNFQRMLARRQQSGRSRSSPDIIDEHTHKKRATPKLVEAKSGTVEDCEMMDVDGTSQPASIFGKGALQGNAAPSRAEPHSTTSAESKTGSQSPSSRQQKQDSDPTPISSAPYASSLTVRDSGTGSERLNWQYLYTQRRRLEANWEQEKFVNFQIPHPNHLSQAHTECIYTIQFFGNHLVSGSRDKTLRIWDLNTRQLVRKPLIGHTGSVLCLQFDADPEEDLIVSGSSDSSVILWKFSTGEIITRLKNAHRESVLNVRFDHRILVTCSKDKTIKVFNRRPLHPGDMGYSDTTRTLNPVPIVLDSMGVNPSPFADLPIKAPFSLLGSLEGHGAAVNAIQIHKNEIVSASGDRNVKVWDWPLKSCTRTLIGHQKGIACVQYDGRRIVSGSSDNEVKVFDKETGLEVASLRAHTNLVRTVQAGFGDLPYSVEEDLAEARHVDNDYFKAIDSGAVQRTLNLNRARLRNAGSRRPEDIMAYGAKLPPGGGGGRYGRIVSGSYDETVIIWRRDVKGAWKPKHTLRQEDAALAASQELRVPRASSKATNDSAQPLSNSAAYLQSLIDQAVAGGIDVFRQMLMQHPHLVQYPYITSAIAKEPLSANRAQMRLYVSMEIHRQQHALTAHLAGQTNAPGPAAAQPAPQGQTPVTPAATSANTANPTITLHG